MVDTKKRPMTAREMARLGGLARAKKLTRQRRIEIARMGSAAALRKKLAQIQEPPAEVAS
jgi:hypothetical protein